MLRTLDKTDLVKFLNCSHLWKREGLQYSFEKEMLLWIWGTSIKWYGKFCYRDDLAKPANNLYLHNLSGILETAIRATNAQFDDSDILKRLDVRLLEVGYVFPFQIIWGKPHFDNFNKFMFVQRNLFLGLHEVLD